jgi:uroporphyrinogen decarboxylase
VTPRERYVETLTFGSPDRIPFEPGRPRESTLAAWRKQGLPEGADWREYLLDKLDIEPEPAGAALDLGVDFRMIPRFEEKVLEHRDGHYVVQDWKGNVCEISDEYDVTYLRQAKDFVTRRWIRCPVESADDWEVMKARYEVDALGRFPADFAERCEKARDRDWVLSVSVSGPFWQMREWCGFEGLCMMMVENPGLVQEMAAFWTEFVSAVLGEILRHIVPDRLAVSEDMAYKERAMISPAMTREFLAPSWSRWSAEARAAGCPLVDMDSDGYVGELVPIWVECGINVCDPLEVAAGNDIAEYRRLFGRSMAYRMGVDKRAMGKGGDAVRAELERVRPVVEDGGYIPGCDHGVPPDVSWPRFVEYSRIIASLTGWR